MKEPVDHIIRPQLPWRNDAGITECGYDASKVKCLTRAEYFARLKEYGQQRSALLTCMTCSSTAARWGTWDDDPRKAIEREVQWETAWGGDDRGQRLRDELTAIALLIEAHREEFNRAVASFADRRAWIERKASVRPRQPKPKPLGLL